MAAPVLKVKGSGDRNCELAVAGELRELWELIKAHGWVLVEAVADAELIGGGEVGDREDAFRVTAGDLNEVGQAPPIGAVSRTRSTGPSLMALTRSTMPSP